MRRRDDLLWRTRLQPGLTVGIVGMRFGYRATGATGHHVLIGDGSALPAVAASLEGVPAAERCTIALAVTDPVERALVPVPSHARVVWGDRGELMSLLSAELADSAPDHLLAIGEVTLVADAYRLATTYGLPTSRVQPIVYWQQGLGADDRDPLVHARYQQAAAAGRDVTNPARVAELELTPV